MKGILFRPDMHKAIHEGRKTVTRRLDNLKEINLEPDKWRFVYQELNEFYFEPLDKHCIACIRKPRYQVGEVVYIKEAYAHYGDTLSCGVWTADVKYKLDDIVRHITLAHQIPPRERWWNTGKSLDYYQTPLFMPAWAARSFIKILDVRPERLQEITVEDIIAEGILPPNKYGWLPDVAKLKFQLRWDSINPKYPWSGNWWVWVSSFKGAER